MMTKFFALIATLTATFGFAQTAQSSRDYNSSLECGKENTSHCCYHPGCPRKYKEERRKNETKEEKQEREKREKRKEKQKK